jgi:tRNA(fMet)-specific endonuclease VapC
MYLLDTNTVIYFFKGMGGVAEKLLRTEPGLVSVSAITVFELEYGIAKSKHSRKRHTDLREFIDEISVIPFGNREAETAAAIRASLESKGTPIGPFDLLIAATALTHQRILVTHNVREFKRIKGFALEDWF